jgi:hypothetical protein
MSIPLYYLIDDNPATTSNRVPEFEGYTRDRLAAGLQDFAGVLCTLTPLAALFRENRSHASVRELTPVFDAAKQEKMDRNWGNPGAPDIRIGLIGGVSQPDALADILAALREVNNRVSVQLFTDAIGLPKLPFPVRLIDSTPSLDEYLTRWKPLGPDILIHVRGSFDPASYENAQLLLIARYLRAVPLVVGGEEANESPPKAGAPAHIIESAILAACDPAYRTEECIWLETHCAKAFAPDQNIRVLAEIAAHSRPVDAVNLVVRLRKMLEHNAGRAVVAERGLQEHQSRLAKAEIELASRSYRVALRLRMLANWVRKINGWFSPR